ncbi:hypothetical protein FRC18_002513 [Serendipita sp. 400]|nr:hypothetical protein FRC18_002513 [Serendipita sp. 400]
MKFACLVRRCSFWLPSVLVCEQEAREPSKKHDNLSLLFLLNSGEWLHPVRMPLQSQVRLFISHFDARLAHRSPVATRLIRDIEQQRQVYQCLSEWSEYMRLIDPRERGESDGSRSEAVDEEEEPSGAWMSSRIEFQVQMLLDAGCETKRRVVVLPKFTITTAVDKPRVGRMAACTPGLGRGRVE